MKFASFGYQVSAAAFAVLSGAAFAAPRVDSEIGVAYDENSGLVTISYTLLDEKAVVTVDMQTNTLADATGDWVSVGDAHLRTLDGAVNRLVESVGTVQKATWHPGHDGIDSVAKFRAVVKAWSVTAPPDWLVVGLALANDVRFYTSTNAFPFPLRGDDRYCVDYIVLRKIPAAGVTWRMGQKGGTGVLAPHNVTLTYDYYMGIYPITQGQYENIRTDKVKNNNPSQYKGNLYMTTRHMQPQDMVTFTEFRGDCSAGAAYDWPTKGHDKVDPNSFLGKLRTLSGVEFDMPTEAQWQYACRAGTGTKYYIGKDTLTAAERKAIGWCNEESSTAERTMARVGVRQPNAWGLCDFYGFLHDRCLDWYQADITTGIDPEKGPESGSQDRVGCGGGWGTGIVDAQSATRNNVGFTASNYRGYRVMCPVSLKW